MARSLPQKTVILSFVFIFAAAIVLGASCFEERGPSRHAHHPSSSPDHSAWCLLSCESAATGSLSETLSFASFLFSGFYFVYSALFPPQRSARYTHGRAPPLPS
ncbi:MAG: hypothetical protein MPW14_11255 [Candidatus Manganitrophus sp.]|nr:MAG: hypothetical protein MPW17_17380 [Candidatus Manganitrophus sp.]WDT82242.1 MAG: hypothetical protein MPW14_11255 [Candidatus Manganitrophus sp.]